MSEPAPPSPETRGPGAHLPPPRRPRRPVAGRQGPAQRRRVAVPRLGEVAGLLARSPVPDDLRPVRPREWWYAGTATSHPMSSSCSKVKSSSGSIAARPGPTSSSRSGAAFGPVVAGPDGAVMFEVMMGDPRSLGRRARDLRGCSRGTGRRGAPRPSSGVPSLAHRLACALGRRQDGRLTSDQAPTPPSTAVPAPETKEAASEKSGATRPRPSPLPSRPRPTGDAGTGLTAPSPGDRQQGRLNRTERNGVDAYGQRPQLRGCGPADPAERQLQRRRTRRARAGI